MTRKTIKYIAFYDLPENHDEERNTFLAATNKIDYICSTLNRNGYDVQIISPSWTNRQNGFFNGKETRISENVILKTFHTFGAENKIKRIAKYFFSLFQLFLFLIFRIKKGEPIIIYHSAILSLPVRFAKLFNKFNVILELEEIYQDVQTFSQHSRSQEFNLIDCADSYIFSTHLLNERVNGLKKPFIVINGTYQVEKEMKSDFGDNKIHVVYAGTFDPRKGGADAAAAAAFLPDNYHVHIIGFGSEKETNDLLKKISEISSRSKSMITYDGVFSGEAYIEFLQKCHIGLSTQNQDASFNDTSFPSKILSYMANGLRVVTVRIKSIETSAVNQNLFYYDEPNPEKIAEAILSIDLDKPYDSRAVIKELDKQFVASIKNLLER